VANSSSNNDSLHDIFICYDDRDKVKAQALYEALEKKEITPWLYDKSMKWRGESIHQALHNGILNSKSSVVIVTPNFLKNDSYASVELNMIFTKKVILKSKLIFAIWHRVKRHDIALYNLDLASVDGIPWKLGIDKVSDELIIRLRSGLSIG
jgi:hypothetical protein